MSRSTSMIGVGSHSLDSDSHTDIPTITEAQGQVLYHDGSNWVALNPGSDGQLLKTQGAAANPAWINSGYQLIGATTLGGANAEISVGSIPTGFTQLLVLFQGTSNHTGNTGALLELNADAAANYHRELLSANTTTIAAASQTNRTVFEVSNDADLRGSGWILVQQRLVAAVKSYIALGGVDDKLEYSSGYWNNNSDEITTVALQTSSSTWRTGTKLLVYGLVD